MLIGVRQTGQPRPWLCTSLAHDSQKRWWRTAPARCVYHAVPRDTPHRSQQLHQLIRSLAYRRRHWCRHHSDAAYCHPGPRCRHRRQTMSRYTALMCLPVCCSVATLTGRLACELRLATSRHESHDISSGTLEYFLLMAVHTCRSCILRDGRVVSVTGLGSRGRGFESRCRKKWRAVMEFVNIYHV